MTLLFTIYIRFLPEDSIFFYKFVLNLLTNWTSTDNKCLFINCSWNTRYISTFAFWFQTFFFLVLWRCPHMPFWLAKTEDCQCHIAINNYRRLEIQIWWITWYLVLEGIFALKTLWNTMRFQKIDRLLLKCNFLPFFFARFAIPMFPSVWNLVTGVIFGETSLRCCLH